MTDQIKISLRSIIYRKKQYVSIFLVTMFGVAISLLCLFLIKGMLFSMQNKARIYYGGDYMFLGGKASQNHNKSEEIIPVLEEVFPQGTVVASRYEISVERSPVFYFEGESSSLRFVKGIDFSKENELFRQLNFKEGDLDGIAGSNGVLISEKTAQKLFVHCGDEITFMLRDYKNQINTATLVVKGIFVDSSIFGLATAYVDLAQLQKVMNIGSKSANRISIILPENTKISSSEENEIYTKLSAKFRMYKMVNEKDDFLNALKKDKSDFLFGLIRLNANLQDLSVIIKAMWIVSALIIAILTLIIVAGVSSTFRVIVMKRINEIGIYKAIGMKQKDLEDMLCFEIFVLLIAGCVAGFFLCLIFAKIISLFTFSFIPAFDIFLSAGSLIPKINVLYFLLIAFIICVTTEIAVVFAVGKTVKCSPCEALAVTE
jgi:ABC-type lipoprotein release transport system permease subunit